VRYRALVRRAFPYLVIGVGGFVLAYVIIFVFVLPARVVAPPPRVYVPDSSHVLTPVDTTLPPPDTAILGAPAMPIIAPDTTPVAVPDVTGMVLRDARTVLDETRLGTRVERDTSSLQPPGTVLREAPAPGTMLRAGGQVTLVVSYFPARPDSLSRDTSPADTAGRSTTGAPPRPTPPVLRRPLPPIVPVPDTGHVPGDSTASSGRTS